MNQRVKKGKGRRVGGRGEGAGEERTVVHVGLPPETLLTAAP